MCCVSYYFFFSFFFFFSRGETLSLLRAEHADLAQTLKSTRDRMATDAEHHATLLGDMRSQRDALEHSLAERTDELRRCRNEARESAEEVARLKREAADTVSRLDERYEPVVCIPIHSLAPRNG